MSILSFLYNLFQSKPVKPILKVATHKADRHDIGFKGCFKYTCRLKCICNQHVEYIDCQTTHSKERPIHKCMSCGQWVKLPQVEVGTRYSGQPEGFDEFGILHLEYTDDIHSSSISRVDQSYLLNPQGDIIGVYKDGETTLLEKPL